MTTHLADADLLVPGANVRTRANTIVFVPEETKVQFATTKNYFRYVAENKEIGKLIGQLATLIKTTKEVR